MQSHLNSKGCSMAVAAQGWVYLRGIFQADVGALQQADVVFVWLKCQAGQEPCGCSRAVLSSG